MVGRQRFPAVLIGVVLVLSSTFPVFGDDGPECGLHYEAPCETAPGHHEGTLVPFANDWDYFSFTPPEGPFVVRVEAESDARLQVALFDPDGDLRAYDVIWNAQEVGLSAVARPTGEWLLEIGYLPGYLPDPGVDTYAFRLGFEAYDHVALQKVPGGAARTIQASLTTGEASHIDLVYPSPGPKDPVTHTHATTWSLLGHKENGDTFGGHSARISFYGHISHDVKTWGSPPADVHFPLPETSITPQQLGFFTYDNGAAQRLRFAAGISSSWGIGEIDLWTAWNGPAPPEFLFPSGDSAEFLTLADFEGGGPGAMVGGFAHVNDLWAEFEVPEGHLETHVSRIHATGRVHTHLGNALPPQVTLYQPDGVPHEIGGGDHYSFGRSVLEGTWRLEIQEMTDWERDRIRFFSVHFPIDRDWVDAPFG